MAPGPKKEWALPCEPHPSINHALCYYNLISCPYCGATNPNPTELAPGASHSSAIILDSTPSPARTTGQQPQPQITLPIASLQLTEATRRRAIAQRQASIIREKPVQKQIHHAGSAPFAVRGNQNNLEDESIPQKEWKITVHILLVNKDDDYCWCEEGSVPICKSSSYILINNEC